MTYDWALINYLWAGWLPQDVDKADRLQQVGEMYWACGNEVQALLPATATSTKLWMDDPLLVACAQLLVDTHNSLGHCGGDKLLSTLFRSYWWPGMHIDVADCVRCCLVYQVISHPHCPRKSYAG